MNGVTVPGRPATIVIFGATGDLTRRLLVPALANLCFDGLLSEELNVIGIALRDGDDESLRVSLDEFAPQTQCWQRLRQRTSYLPGDFTLGCGSAWKKDPGSGVIGVEKGPLIPVV